MYIAPGHGQRTPPPRGTKFWWQQKCLVTSFICCKFKKMSLKSDFIHFFFHDLIHVYSLGAGAESPQGTILNTTERPYHFTQFVASFKEISLKSDFIKKENIYMIYYMYIAPGQGHTAPKWHGFDVNKNFYVLTVYHILIFLLTYDMTYYSVSLKNQ